jgi:hypothetical protein
LGATAHTFSQEQIETLSQGANAPFNQVILRAPGVAQDSAANGDLHVRGEHGICNIASTTCCCRKASRDSGWNSIRVSWLHAAHHRLAAGGNMVSARRVLWTSRPKAARSKTAARRKCMAAVTTPSGQALNTAARRENGITSLTAATTTTTSASKIPRPATTAIHDMTDQGKAFVYASCILSDTSRVSLMGSASYSNFQVPNTPGLQNDPANYSAPGGQPWNTGSTVLPASLIPELNENQNEQNYYGVATYQKSAGDLNLQASIFGRNSNVHFTPDPIGDLFFNGVASDVDRNLYSGGLQADASYSLGDKHTIRGGVMLLDEYLSADSTTTAILMDSTDPGGFNPLPGSPTTTIVQNGVSHALFAGVYLQDEWKILPEVTINYGARFDEYYSPFDKENQPSPRANIIWQPTDSTTLHAGYARYFTPPPLENVPSGNVNQFDGTANEFPPARTRRMAPSRPSARIISTPAFRKKSQSTCRSAWTAITRRRKNSLTTDCSGRRSSSRRSITPRQGLWSGIHRLLQPRRIFQLCQLRLVAGVWRNLELGAIPVLSE